MQRWWVVSSFVVLAGLVAGATDAAAQSLGTFKWRTEPYCNVITVTVTPIGGVYALDGFDEQCGGNPRQPVRGVALPQANGSITIGVSIVVLPGGAPVNLEAGISQSSLNGTWRDSAGNSGQLIFGPTSTSGGPRPGPIPGGGQLPSAFVVQPQGGFAVTTNQAQPPAIPASGPGQRMMWHGAKSAFRAGKVQASQWDEVNTGFYSAAFGLNTVASGTAGFAAGADSGALGAVSVALGSGATALGDGSFVFGDRSTTAAVQSGPNQFVARAAGGTYVFTNSALTAGVRLLPGASAWSSLSDANSKEHFTDLDGADVLAKIARMPIREWNYKAQDAAIRHVGPTAQDFAAAFGLGEDPLRISTIDADGIALRAIQALEARTRDENVVLRRENAELRSALESLRARIDALAPPQ